MNKIFFSLALFLFSLNFVFSQNDLQDSNKELETILGGYVLLNNEQESIDFANELDNGLLVKIVINDTEYIFLLDTASSVSIINNNIKEIGKPISKITTTDNFDNESEKDLYLLDFKIGQNVFKDFAFIQKNLSDINYNTCLNIDGIIGINILKKLNWKIVKNEKKIFFSKKEFDYNNFYEPTSIRWFNNLIPLIELNTKSSNLYLAIDTGYFGTIKLSEENYNLINDNYKKLIKGSGQPFFSIEKSIKTDLRKTFINDLSLKNGLNFSNYEIVIDNSKPIIGQKILFNDNLILNFLTSEISFGKKINIDKIESNDLNFKICKSSKNNNEIEVCFFWNSDNNKNLKVGDRIIKIDNFSTENISHNDYCELLNYIKKREVISVIFQRGKKQFTNNINLTE